MEKIIIAGDKSGDYICDGKDDHVQINAALEYQIKNPDHSIYFKGPFTYVLDDTLLTGNNALIEGDKTACITIKDNNRWASGKPLIQQKNAKAGKITIRGFEIDGNADNNNPDGSRRGDGYHNLMLLYYSDVEISDMYLHDSLGDGLKVKYSQNVKFHHNRVYKLGHDVVYAIKCNNVEVWKNNIRTMTNSASRMFNTNHVKIHDNTIWTEYGPDAGGPGLQIQYGRESAVNVIMDDIEIYNNIFKDTYGPGIALVGYLNGGSSYAKSEACNVHIHHNAFYGCGTHSGYTWMAGIVTSGFNNTLIENNVFDGNYHAGVSLQNNTGVKSPGSGYIITVKKNIIVNTKQRKYQPAGTGNGVVNYLSGTHSFVLEKNCFYNNPGGDYKNTGAGVSDIHVDPLFADLAKHDYHLKSTAGRWTSSGYVQDSVASPCLFETYELGMYDGTDQASVYPGSVIPEKIPSLVFVSCSPEQADEIQKMMPGRVLRKI